MNRLKIFLTLVVFILALLGSSRTSHAYNLSTTSASSAKLVSFIEAKETDERVETLKEFLSLYESPLALYADSFVRNADKYSLDWRLVASIAGLESTFGKNIPYNSYNAWGWGIYGGKVTRFTSWDEGIEKISRGLRENYLKEIEYSDPYIIGPTYAASPTWASRVVGFMGRIENFKSKNTIEDLPLAS